MQRDEDVQETRKKALIQNIINLKNSNTMNFKLVKTVKSVSVRALQTFQGSLSDTAIADLILYMKHPQLSLKWI